MSSAPRIFRGKIWITRIGEQLDPLTDMSVEHLENTIKFIQLPERLEHFKNMFLHEFLSFPPPSGEMATIAYEQSIQELQIILEKLSPKQYFEEHIEPSPLFQRLLKAYFYLSAEKEQPKPFLPAEMKEWYETGKRPTFYSH